MSKVKTSSVEIESIENYIKNADEIMQEILDIWGENFDNLYNNFVTSGFLEDLYKDAESQYYNLANAGYVVSYTAQGAATGALAGGILGTVFAPITATLGAIIGGVIGFFCGITHCIQNPTSIKWCYDSKNVFVELLERCMYGNDDNYIALYNLKVKLENMALSMLKLKAKINEFQKLYANLNATAEAMGVKTTLADDGMTVLSVDTEVTIDGQTIELSTSDALNAFYTYENTVMSAMIEADILERTYGYDIDYNAIVKNANSFMADTINSGLYSHEFIDALLPNYTPDENAAYDATSAATEIDNDKLKSLMSDVSNLNIFPGLGLMSAALIGKVGTGDDSSKNLQPTGDTPPTGPTGGTPSGTTGGTTIIGTPTGGTSTTTKPDEDKNKEEEKEEEKKNDIEITEISDEELPESVSISEEVDYDALAKEKFEFESGYEELLEHRSEIIQDIETKFDSGDLDSIREELKEYGYNSAEIDAILEDRFMTIKAIVQGDQDAQLSKMAHELAKADGIEDFTSKYEGRPDYTLLEDDGPSDSLMLASEDEKVVELYDEMVDAKVAYNETIEETNKVLQEVTKNKQAMEDLKVKYEEEYGEDTTQWTEEAANEYNEAIETYNKSVEDATKQMKVLEESKTTYETARKEFTDAREAYYEKQRNGQPSQNDSNVTDDSNMDGTNNIQMDGDKPIIPGAENVTPTTDGITYLDGSGATNDTSKLTTVDDSVVVTDNSIEIKDV